MKRNHKRFILTPLVTIFLCLLILSIVEPWKLYKWIPLRDFSWFNRNFRHAFEVHEGEANNFFKLYADSGLRSQYFNKLKYYVEGNPDNAKFYFALAMLTSDSSEMIDYLKKADEVAPNGNPMYPFYLGLAYSNNLKREGFYGIPDPELEVNREEALEAFNRAGKLDPDNAAIDLAKVQLYVEDMEDTMKFSYAQRLEYITRELPPPYPYLTEKGREIMRGAMKKGSYKSYNTDAISTCLKLMTESCVNNFFYRTYLLETYLVPVSPLKAVDLFVMGIGPFESKAEANNMMDTILSLAHLGFMMREDESRTPYQQNRGGYLMTHILDVLGDLYLVNKLESSERLVGLFSANDRNWETLWKDAIGYGYTLDYWGVSWTKYIVLINSYVEGGLFLILILLTLVGLIGIISTRKYDGEVSLSGARLSIPLMFIMGFVLLLICMAIGIDDHASHGMLAGVIKILLSLALFAVFFFVKKLKAKQYYLLPLFWIFVGIFGFWVNLMEQRITTILGFPQLLIIPTSILISAIVAKDSRERNWSAYWRRLCRLSSEVLVVLTVLLFIQLASVSSPLERYMNMGRWRGIDIMNLTKGPSYSLYSSDNKFYGPHYIANDGSSASSRNPRLYSMEKMFGKKLKLKND
ncbi:hypothetical protein JXI42_00405 [bacterium]|nr:hypothetical protein [bacterium]